MLTELLPGAIRLAAFAAGVAGLLFWVFSRYQPKFSAPAAAVFCATAGFLLAYGREISIVPLALPASPLTKLPYLLLIATMAGAVSARNRMNPNTILSILALIAVFWIAAPYLNAGKIRIGLTAFLGIAAAQAMEFDTPEGSSGAMAGLLAALTGMAIVAMIQGSHLGPFAFALAAALSMVLAASGASSSAALAAPALAGWLALVTAAAVARPALLIPAALSAVPMLLEPSLRAFYGNRRPFYWTGLGSVTAAGSGLAILFAAHNL